MRRPCAPCGSRAQLRAEMREHLLGVIAGRFLLDHGGFARRRQRREQHGGLQLRRRRPAARRRSGSDRARPAASAAGGRLRRRSALSRPCARADRARAASAACAGDASPSKVAVIGQPATAPMTRRQPVPELPKSSDAAGCAKPPTPTPCTVQAPSPVRSTVAPSARIALAVLMHVLAFEQARDAAFADRERAEISARCEMDLSPGTRTRPLRAGERRGGER